MTDSMHHPLTQIEIIHQLTEVGLTQKQAEAHARIITEVREHTLATKDDVKDLQQDLRRLESKLGSEITLVRKDLELLKSDLLAKITIIMGTLLALFSGLQKLLGN